VASGGMGRQSRSAERAETHQVAPRASAKRPPATLGAADIVSLQRLVGNRAVSRWISSHRSHQGHQPSPAARLMIQRDTAVGTPSGTFSSHFAHDMDQQRIARFGIELTFVPNEHIRAEKIGMIQTSRQAIGGATIPYSPSATKKQTPAGYSIDRASKRNNPVYGAADLPAGAADLAATAMGEGEFGTYELGKRTANEMRPAWMRDQPNFPGLRNGGMDFETTALSLDNNAQQDRYFGSVRWGFTVDGDGIITPQDISLVSPGNPSPSFREAAVLWNQSASLGNLGKVYTNQACVMSRPDPPGAFNYPANTPLMVENAENPETYRVIGGVPCTMCQDLGTIYQYGWIPTVALTDISEEGTANAQIPLPGPPAAEGA
jgi:hypothetical protein